MDKRRDAMSGGDEGAPFLAELFPLCSPCGGWKEELQGPAPETGMGHSRVKATCREEPPSMATPPSTLKSQMHLGIWWGATDYAGFVVCLGRRRKLEVEGGEYGASADKIP